MKGAKGFGGITPATEIESVEIEMPKCPFCETVQQDPSYNPSHECGQCNRVFNAAENQSMEPVEILRCPECATGRYRNSWKDKMLVDCINCSMLLAVQLNDKLHDPNKVLGLPCKGNTGFVRPSKSSHRLATKILVGLAQYEISAFMRYDSTRYEYLLHCVDGYVIGYLSWNNRADVEGALLNQIWVEETHRGQGYATTLLEEWCREEIGDESVFSVESPNQQGRGLLESVSDKNGQIHSKQWGIESLG